MVRVYLKQRGDPPKFGSVILTVKKRDEFKAELAKICAEYNRARNLANKNREREICMANEKFNDIDMDADSEMNFQIKVLNEKYGVKR